MKYKIIEEFIYPIGSKMPDTIIDYRDPEKNKIGFFPYEQSQLDYINSDEYIKKFGKSDAKGYEKKELPSTHIVLTKDGKVIVYFYADNNIIAWKELVGILRNSVDKTLQDDELFGIIVKDDGYIISSRRGDLESIGSWTGNKTKYSIDLKQTVRALFDRKIAKGNTPIFLGNDRQNKLIGSVREILKISDTPNKITVYHGTSSYRWHYIQKNGLKALPLDDRVWNKGGLEKIRPEHREYSVYLTASIAQAEYYANKAVNVDRKRYGPKKRRDARDLINRLQSVIQSAEFNLKQVLKNPDELIKDPYNYYGPEKKRLSPDIYKKWIDDSKEKIEKLKPLIDYYGDMEPIILEITLQKSDYKFLLADDDYLRKHYSDMAEQNAHVKDWRHSLSDFGQIAFNGTIPPSRITIKNNS